MVKISEELANVAVQVFMELERLSPGIITEALEDLKISIAESKGEE